MKLDRRSFLARGGVVAAAACTGCMTTAQEPPKGGSAAAEPEKAAPAASGKLIVSAPMLQNPAPDSMGVAFAVSALANGFVDVSLKPDLSNARRVTCGGFRVTDMNDRVMLVRLTGLMPATRYYYRIGADRILYECGYMMRILGTETEPVVRSFVTSGEKAESAFAVINDTHERWEPFDRVLRKVESLKAPVLLWNGDASNSQETIESQVKIFLAPPVSKPDYAAGRGVLFCPGNHDSRGLANRHIERVFMFRQPEERLSRDWDLGRNFAFRQGDIALIGLDTAEDKLDSRDIFAGLFVSEPYREAQTRWLREALERPEIKSAPFIVAFCHIPLFDPRPDENPGDLRPNDQAPGFKDDYAAWQRTCARMWGPLFNRAGVQLVVTAHQHRYRYDRAGGDRKWDQIVGGGPSLKDTPHFATVIEGRVEAGRLAVRVHDVAHDKVVGTFSYAPRAVSGAAHDPRCVFSMYVIEGAKQSGVPLAKAIDRIMAAGVRAIDVGLDEVASAQQMVAAGMHVESVYWDVRFLDDDNGEKSGDELLAAAKLLGSPRIMVLPQAFPKGADKKACMRRTIEGLRKLVAKAKAAGIVATVEDFGCVDSPCASIVQLKEMFDAIPDLKFTLDAGNFYAIGANDDPLKALEMFRDRIVHCHVKDYRAGAAGKWCPLGKGCIPNEKIVRTLMSSGYRGYFTIEETAAPDYLKAVEDAERCLSSYLHQ